jgi:hypothetical protein
VTDSESTEANAEAEGRAKTAAGGGGDAVRPPGYRLALSRLHLSTTRHVSVPKQPGADDAPPVSVTFETASRFVVLADPSHRRPFPAGAPAGREAEIAVTLGEDERLQSLSVTSTGVGPRVLAAGAQLLGTVVGTVSGLGGIRLKGALPGLPGVEPTIGGGPTRDDLTARREKLLQAIDAGEERLVELSTAAAAEPAQTASGLQASRLERELTRLRRQLDDVDARLAKIAAQRAIGWREADEAHLFIRDLPAEPVDAADAPSDGVTFAGLRAGATWDEADVGAARAMLLRFGVLVCVRDAEAPEESPKQGVPDRRGGGARPIPGAPVVIEQPGTPLVITRAPRAIEASLYTPLVPSHLALFREAPDGDIRLRLVSRTRVLVVDESSDHVAVPLADAGLFGKSAVEVTLGPSGAVTGLSSSTATTAPEAVTGALAAFQLGLDAGEKLLASSDRLAGRGMQGEIADLKAEKERVQLVRELTPSVPDPQAAARKKLLDDIELQRQSAALQRELAELQILQDKATADEE